ncbi:MAG: class I SAM-dependent methyltransferase [Saprospiraceae bacterium]|nr:class I SAM-dependent methyltransferase [Saprospiraceae bacterium]
MNTSSDQVKIMQRFYRWQAGIYDATRWAFLFGRQRLLHLLPHDEHFHFVEIGCGTGRNLRHLAGLRPTWQFTGIDVSPDMLRQARKATAAYSDRVNLLQIPYGTGISPLREPVDVILFSYSLTMFNPGWEAAIEQAWHDLRPGGIVAAVDFHDTPYTWFRNWMTANHVRMDRHLLPFFEKRFQPEVRQVHATFGLLWRYFLFVGKK